MLCCYNADFSSIIAGLMHHWIKCGEYVMENSMEVDEAKTMYYNAENVLR